MSTPAPAPTPLALSNSVQTVITLDVQDLARSCAFYQAALDYSVIATERAGMLLEARILTSTRFPAVALRLRAAFGKRVGGSQPGGLMKLSFSDSLDPERLAYLPTLVHFITSPALEGQQPHAVAFNDPDGYFIELCSFLPPLM